MTQQPLSSRRSQPRGEHKHSSTKDTDNLEEKDGHGNVITSKEIEVFLEEETLELRSESRMMKIEIQPRSRKGKVF